MINDKRTDNLKTSMQGTGLDKIFYCEKKFCRVICKDGEVVSGIVRMVSYQGDNDPDENFIIIGPYGIIFDDIDSIEEVPDPTEPEILTDELWRSYDDRKRVDEIFNRLDSFLKEDHPEDEKKVITTFMTDIFFNNIYDSLKETEK